MKITDLQAHIERIREERDWKQFHDPKDLALSLNLEAAEVLEHFQWKDKDQFRHHLETHRQDISHELADVLYWTLLLAADLGIDLEKAALEKLKIVEEKYPVEKAKGTARKYTEL